MSWFNGLAGVQHEARGIVRYVEHKTLASAGGLTSGIDLALRVVERFYGPAESRFTAEFMEYKPSSAAPFIAFQQRLA